MKLLFAYIQMSNNMCAKEGMAWWKEWVVFAKEGMVWWQEWVVSRICCVQNKGWIGGKNGLCLRYFVGG